MVFENTNMLKQDLWVFILHEKKISEFFFNSYILNIVFFLHLPEASDILKIRMKIHIF